MNILRQIKKQTIKINQKKGSDVNHHYHSIFSIEIGLSFIFIFSAVPFLKYIILSAIGAIAELCVIIMTVIFSFLQVSCNNFKICLPVL